MSDEAAARRFMVEAIQRFGHGRDRAKAHEMRGKECPIQRPMCQRWRVKQ